MAKLVVLAFLAAAAVPSAGAQVSAQQVAGADTPAAAVKLLHEALAGAAERVERVEERARLLEPAVEATHDLPYIAELTIRRQWPKLSDEDRQRFVEAFSRLSVATYASRFGSLRPGMFEVAGAEQLAGGRARVTATLRTASGRTIPFEYVLHQDQGGAWKIVNILADNVSDLALKRAEYRRLLEEGSIDRLIAELDRQAEAAAQ